MPKFLVNFSLSVNKEIVVEAETEDEAMDKVNNGEIDTDSAYLCDEGISCVNNATRIED